MHCLKLARAFSEFQNMCASPLDQSAEKPKHSAPVYTEHARSTENPRLKCPPPPPASVGLCLSNLLWPVQLLLHVLLFSPSPLPCSSRESRRSLLPPSSSLSQRDAKAYRSVCQNQRCLGDPSRIPAVDQETGQWAVWGSMDGYAETQLLFY